MPRKLNPVVYLRLVFARDVNRRGPVIDMSCSSPRLITVVLPWSPWARCALRRRPEQAPPLQSLQPDAQVALSQRALLDRYCVTCHNSRAKTGGLVLENADLSNVGAHGEVWEKVVRKLRAGMMPPPGLSGPPP